MKRANTIINSLPVDLLEKDKGKMAAVEIYSGDYFIGETEWDAYQAAVKKYPDHKFVFVKIGSEAARFVG